MLNQFTCLFLTRFLTPLQSIYVENNQDVIPAKSNDNSDFNYSNQFLFGTVCSTVEVSHIHIYIYIYQNIYRLLISRITNHKNQQMMNDIKSIGPLIDKQKNVSVHVKIDLKELKEAVGMINCSIRWKETKVQAEEYTERSKSYWKQTVTEDNPWPWKQWRYQNEK